LLAHPRAGVELAPPEWLASGADDLERGDEMYEEKKDQIDRLKTRFDVEMRARSPAARKVADEYLNALTDFIRSYDDGPASDPDVFRHDTTGQLTRVEEHAEWAEQERHRVRRALNDIA
jgi:hypothetical protein